MALDRINATALLDGGVTTADIADDAVTSAKLDTNIDIAGTLDVTGVLTADSNVQVGKTSSDYQSVGVEAKTNGSLWATADGNGPLIVVRKTSDGTLTDFYKDTTKVGSIGTVSGGVSLGSGDTGLYFESVSNEIRPFNTTTNASIDNAINLGNSTKRFKDLYLSGGVYLGGTGSANYLDDYEEGTWTPQIWKNTTQVTSPISALGQYRKIGDVIFYGFYFYKSSGSNTDSNEWQLKGLPFAMEAASATGYTSLTAGYTAINGVNYFDQAGSHRWQNNGNSSFSLYGPQQTTQWTTGHLEFAGYGFVYAA